MTIKEVITELSKYPEDCEVYEGEVFKNCEVKDNVTKIIFNSNKKYVIMTSMFDETENMNYNTIDV